MCKYYNFSLRQCNKYVQQGKLIKEYIDRLNSFDYRYNQIINTLIPMLLAIKMYDIMKYSQIINGKGQQDFVDCILNNSYIKKVIKNVVTDKQSKNVNNLDTEVIVSLYEALFCNNQNNMWTNILNYNTNIVCDLLTLASKKINYNTKELVAKY